MKKFNGKTLLELGTNVGSKEIIEYAQSNGARVIVADYLSPEKSIAKKISDSHFEISTTDIDGLVLLAKEHGVDAVFSGVSELNLESARKVSACLNLKTLYSGETWNKFMNKNIFRDLCEKYNVPTPKTFYKGPFSKVDADTIETFELPVIIKPDDSCANQGITICYTIEDVQNACRLAAEYSNSSEIIIEELVEGIEISATYVIKDNKCKLVCYGDKHAYINENGLRALSNVYVYPGNSLKEYLNSVNPYVEEMILSEELNNCTIFFQGIFDGNRFAIFEAGLRMEGTASFKIVEKMVGQNFMEFLVDELMDTKTNYNLSKNDPFFGGRKCIKYSMISSGGVVGRIEGFNTINDPNIISKEQRHYPGDDVPADGTLRQIMFRFDIIADNMEDAIKSIVNIQNTIKAYDENDKYMIVTGFDPKKLLSTERD